MDPYADADADPTLTVLCLGVAPRPDAASDWGPFVWREAATPDDAVRDLARSPADALLWSPTTLAVAQAALAPDGPLAGVARRLALLLVTHADANESAAVRAVMAAGVQDVLSASAPADALARAVRLAVERQRRELALRDAHATDLATGLPTHAQLLEHMTHLLALREREPAPMALIVLQVDGLSQPAISPTAEAEQVLRRKVAVRLRAALRASDVVAAIGDDRFAVLLAWIDAADAGPRVAAKLAASLRQPFKLGGATCRVSVRMGLAAYPGHGRDAETLLARALGQAASTATAGAARREPAHPHGAASAANDD